MTSLLRQRRCDSVRLTASRQAAIFFSRSPDVHRRLEAAVALPGFRETPPCPARRRRRGRRARRRRAPSSPGSAGGRPARPGCRRGAAWSSRSPPCRRRPAAPSRTRRPASRGASPRCRSWVWKADRLERRAGELARAGRPRQAEERAARLGVPIGRAEAGEGGDEDHLLRRIGLRRERAGLVGALDQLQPVAQPLHGGAGDEDRAFQRIGGAAVEPVGDGGQKLVLARRPPRAPVLSTAKQPVP